MKKTLYPLLLLCFSLALSNHSAAQTWFRDATTQDASRLGGDRQIQPSEARIIGVNLELIKDRLSEAPMWHTPDARLNAITVKLPLPNGQDRTFKVVEAPVMDDGLSARFPGMRSFAGYSIEDGTAYARFGYTHKGFHAMILSGMHSTVFIDVYSSGQTRYHQVYYKSDYSGIPDNDFNCRTEEEASAILVPDIAPAALLGDCSLRDYRLAIGCTGEYAQFHGGTIPDVLAAYNVAMTRVNGVYERDFTIHMDLMDETDQVIFLDADTDPYSNNSSVTLLGENQATLDEIIGFDNYDIGHVFSTGGGGVASLASVCTNRKARGVTGLPSPVNDPFYIDYVSHEIGHQFGANHTQNNSCNRAGATAMEPGSASTIMGYAGICSPNVQNNSDDYFHAISIQEVTNTIEFGASSTCPEIFDLDNTGPQITSGPGTLFLPVSTPFFLTADAMDAEGDAMTYCWEQMDNEVATMPPVSASTGGPAFRSLLPVPSPTRYFPNLSSVVSNTPDAWEVLPSVSRTMDFRCSVRDNFPGGGCVNSTDVELIFSDDAGPFVVQQPNTDLVWQVGDLETVVWDVAGTDGAPVNCNEVDIYLSKDGGFTYPILLAQNVPNDGVHEITVPLELTSAARVQVVASDNIFYDISDENFAIQFPPSPTVLMALTPSVVSLCGDTSASFEIVTTSVAGFGELLELSATGLPTGAIATFSANPVGPDDTTVLTVSNLDNLASGLYELSIEASSPSLSKTVTVELEVAAAVPVQPAYLLPIAGAQQVPVNTTLTWGASSFADQYQVEVATSPGFGAETVISAVLTDTTYALADLQEHTVYYWRAIPVNECGEGDATVWSSFLTIGNNCIQYLDAAPGLDIPPSGTGEFPTTLSVDDEFLIEDFNVGLIIDHTWIGDLSATLTAEDGTIVTLFDQPGVPGSDFGCSQDNLLVDFDDEAMLTAEDLENTCASGGSQAISGTFRPLTPLAAFEGLSVGGTWTLTISDAFNQDGGSLVAWWIEACPPVEAPSPADTIANVALEVPYAQEETISSAFLAYEKEGIAPEDITYRLTALPENGTLQVEGAGVLGIGDIFSQADINAELFTYQHDGSFTTADEFIFDLTDSAGGWRSSETFQILIADPAVLSAVALEASPVSCAGAADGVIEVVVSGGLPPYAFVLNDSTPQETSVFGNLPAGDYAVVVTDASGQETVLPVISFVAPEPLELSVSTSVNTLVLEALGGTAPYQFSIDGGQSFGEASTFEGLANGAYEVAVEDANGCLTTASFTINLLQNAEVITTESSCAGTTDGSITAVDIQGGEEPYIYSLNGAASQSDPVFTGLGEGLYDLQITDANGSQLVIEQILIDAPAPLTLNTTLESNDLMLEADGGVPPYQYSIDGGDNFGTPDTFADLPNGTYTVMVVDANDCTSEEDITINLLLSADITVTDASCNDTANGSLVINSIEGGEAPYTYQLGEGAVQDSPVFDNLPAGVYTLTMVDVNGNALEVEGLVVSAPNPLSLSADVDLTSITLSASGGTPPYSYSIDGGSTFGTDPVFTGLANGTYTLVIQDANGCAIAGQALVNVLVNAAIDVLDVSCAGAGDGVLTVSGVQGGEPPFSYSLNGGDEQSDSVFDNLTAGTYSVQITDANGSVLTLEDVLVPEPPLLELNVDVDGPFLALQATGGTPPYIYSIDGGATFTGLSSFSDLDNGEYEVVVQDANGCTFNTVAVINIIVNVNLDISNLSCAGSADGRIEVLEVIGGNPSYSYQLDGGAFVANPFFDGLSAGTYELNIMDSEGFIFASSIELLEPAALEAVITVSEDSISVEASGGTLPYSYSIDGGETFSELPVFSELPSGEYSVLVRDANGCLSVLQTVTVLVSGIRDVPDSWVVRLLPNPTRGPLLLRGDGFEVSELEWAIVSPLGQILQSGKLPVTDQQWELRGSLMQLPAGIYWVQLRTEKARGAWPVIKQ